MPASALALATSVASLNLCADEYVLLLARPEQIVSVSYLAKKPAESVFWRRSQTIHGNRGSIEDVIERRPKLLFIMGGGGRATAAIARRLGIRTIDLPAPETLRGVADNLRRTGVALGRGRQAEAWIERLESLRRDTPASARDAIWLSGGGLSLAASGLGADWMRLAGLRQRPLPEGRASLETLLVRPPQVLLRSNYRSGEMSAGTTWLNHPIVRNARTRHLVTDGRPWTCMGPAMIPEIERIRRLVP